mmetsp:Transcript_22440/g.63202  ORF Transcript_22440/g.63202 Transcript_22440/m.63202 type:complete len:141 (+) Transcript_22440:57-479(+)
MWVLSALMRAPCNRDLCRVGAPSIESTARNEDAHHSCKTHSVACSRDAMLMASMTRALEFMTMIAAIQRQATYNWWNGAILGVLYTPAFNANIMWAKMQGNRALKARSTVRRYDASLVSWYVSSHRTHKKSYTLTVPVMQ